MARTLLRAGTVMSARVPLNMLRTTLIGATFAAAPVAWGPAAWCQTTEPAPTATPDPLAPTDATAPVETATVPTVETLTEGDDPGAGLPSTATSAAASPGLLTPSAAATELGSPSVPGSTDDAARLKIWASPQMVEARAYVEEYGRRSVQFNSQAAQRYLTQLRQASPLEMQAWLERYTARRAATVRANAVARSARQTAVDQTLARLQAVRQSYENFNLGQTEGALIARDRLQTQQQIAGMRGAAKQWDRDSQLALQYATDYSWIVNPPLSVRQRAAASSVPGDLPAGDPRNFLRGDVPVPGDPPSLGGAAAGTDAGDGGGTGGGEGAGGAP